DGRAGDALLAANERVAVGQADGGGDDLAIDAPDLLAVGLELGHAVVLRDQQPAAGEELDAGGEVQPAGRETLLLLALVVEDQAEAAAGEDGGAAVAGPGGGGDVADRPAVGELLVVLAVHHQHG